MRTLPFCHRSFHQQLTIAVSAAIVGFALMASVMNTVATGWRAKHELLDAGRQVAGNLARQSTLALLTHEPDNAALGVSLALAFPDVMQVEIVDAAARPLLRRPAREGTEARIAAALAGLVPIAPGVTESSSVWVFTAPVMGGTAADSPFEPAARNVQLIGHVRVVIDKTSRRHLQFAVLVSNLVMTLAGATVLLIIVRRLTDRLITPLGELAALMRRAKAGESGLRAHPSGPNDIHDMALAFNAMMHALEERLADAYRAERYIRHQAHTDSLTGLSNRTHFIEHLAERIEKAKDGGESVTVFYLDINRFKDINDTLGHRAGDLLLVVAANRIKSAVRRADCVARLGGDEFVVAMTDLTADDALTIATNVGLMLSESMRIENHDLVISASIGIAAFPHDAADTNTLIKHADIAMYKAKKSEAGIVVFDTSMADALSRHIRLENELRRAIDEKELEVFYQPKSLTDGTTIVGMEALVRWRHPTRGLVSPNDFIPLAEDTGLIVPLGTLVLRTACAQIQDWIDRGFKPLPVAVNASSRQLRQPNFVQCVEQALQDTGLAPHLLKIEITESTLMEDTGSTMIVLQRLHALGVMLTIDDFGTGYSSLAYLKRFPIDTLKIDRAFICDIPDADDGTIAIAVLALAHTLRLEVVAEGVETREQLAFLKLHGCDQVQGYLIAKPLSANDFEQRFLTARGVQNAYGGGR